MTAKRGGRPDSFPALLAAWDEAALGGREADPPDPPAELRSRLERGLACVGLLREVLRSDRPAVPPPSGAGDSLGRFHILRELGRGSYGVVFLAHDPRLGREVALKVPRPEGLASPELRVRFVREARAAAGLDHPNLVSVYEVGEAGPVCYIASAYCPGPTLADWLKRRADLVPPRQAGLLVAVLAEAIHHAHGRGVIHRDLKPGNILLCADPETAGAPSSLSFVPKIADFGLAKFLDAADLAQTATGSILGTPSYMAPEQAAGNPREVGPAADVYALGAILYELLTGRPPFRADNPLETLRQVVEDDPEPPRRLQPRCPRDLENICLKCLEKQPARRYASAAALAADVHRFLEGRPVLARAAGPIERATKWARRRPAWAGLVGMTLLTAVGLVAGLIGHNASLRSERDNALHQGQIAAQRESEATNLAAITESQRKLLEQRERTTRRALHAARMNLAQQAWEAGRVGRALELLEGQRPHEGEEDLRGFDWYYLWRLCHGERWSWKGWPTPMEGDRIQRFTLALSPDGALAADGDGDDVRLWDVAAGRECDRLRGHAAKVDCLNFAADGRTLATGAADGTAILWDLATRRPRTTLGPYPLGLKLLLLSPNGQWLAASGAKGGVVLWDATGAEKRTVLPVGWSGAWLLAFSADGKTTAVVMNDNRTRVTLWDSATGQRRAVLEGHTGQVDAIAFAPDGRTIATRSQDRSARVWETESGKQVALFRETGDCLATSMAYSPDGGTLAVAAGQPWDFYRSGKVRLWDVATRQEREAWDVPEGGAWALAFSPDGKRLAVGENRGIIRLHDLAENRVTAALHGHRDRIAYLAFSPDGRTLTSASVLDGCIKNWDPNPLPEDKLLQGHVGHVEDMAVAPDGWTWACAGADGAVDLWDVATGQSFARLPRLPNGARAVAFSPDGKTLAAGGADGTLTLSDAASGREIRRWKAFEAGICAVRFSPDGRSLLSVGGRFRTNPFGEVVVWDAATGAERRRWAGLPDIVWSGAWSADGRLLAWAGEGRVAVWDWAADREVLTQQEDGGLMSAAFSPDGRTLAVATWGARVRLWDLTRGVELPALEGHAAAVLAVAFSPDGRTLASAGNDATVKLWDFVTGQERFTLRGRPAKVCSLAFSRDGKALTAGYPDGLLQWWDAGDDRDDGAAVDDAWLKRVASLPADEQAEAVGRMLQRRNRGFNGQVKAETHDGVVTALAFSTDAVTDLAPVRALTGLKELRCNSGYPSKGRLADLSPLGGLPLTLLDCADTQVSDLSPLKGMELTTLYIDRTQVSDPSPLKGMPLEALHCDGLHLKDFSFLKGMKLRDLVCSGTGLLDLALLEGMPLEALDCGVNPVADLSPLRGAPLHRLMIGGTRVADLSPVRGMALRQLSCTGDAISDLSPLRGMPLEYLTAGYTSISDLSPLRGMPLTLVYCYHTQVTDLSPLAGAPLKEISFDESPKTDWNLLSRIQSLDTINGWPADHYLNHLPIRPATSP